MATKTINGSTDTCPGCGVAPGVEHKPECTGGCHKVISPTKYLVISYDEDEQLSNFDIIEAHAPMIAKEIVDEARVEAIAVTVLSIEGLRNLITQMESPDAIIADSAERLRSLIGEDEEEDDASVTTT